MKTIRMVLTLILCFSANLAFAAAEDDPDKFQLEAITLKFMPGKGLEDLLALREQFGAFAKAGNMQYDSRILVPWAVSKAALPASDDWDVIWFGVTRNVLEYADNLSYYVGQGSDIAASFDEVFTEVGRTMMRGEAIFRSGVYPEENIGVAMLRTCSLKPGQTMGIAKTAMAEFSEKLSAIGSKGSTFLWTMGPGAAPALEGSVIMTRWQPSINAWGETVNAARSNDISNEVANMNNAMDCSAFRFYLNYPYYDGLG